MTFKEALRDDRDDFFDAEEFASQHIIDGQSVECVVQHADIAEAGVSHGLMKATLNPKEKAISNFGYLIYAKEEDIRSKVTANALMKFDGERMMVKDVRRRDEGYIRITLVRTKV